MSLSPSPETFTPEKLRTVWREGRYVRVPVPGSSRSSRFEHVEPNLEDVVKKARIFCLRLHASVQDPVSHLSRINETFAPLLKGRFRATVSEDAVVQRACHLLSRLPATPIDILESLSPDNFDNSTLDEYLVHRLHESPTSTCILSTRWDHLRVVASVDTTVIRIALWLAWYKHERRLDHFPMRKFIDGTTALLRLAFQLSSEPGAAGKEQSWVIVKAFLWTLWQRALMLCFWDLLERQLRCGYQIEANRSLAIQGVTSFPEIFAQRTLQQSEDSKKAPYMCGWAYELLRTDRACIMMDFRRFHQCYGELFGDRPARCKDGQQQCDGRSPANCQRFKGATVLDQSAHDWKCEKDCKRLYWDRVSFLNVSGAKAVCLSSTDDRRLRYCKASNKTLAISHVWSHGQGGRPDTTGFNACLHNRYADLAIVFNCDSYWMDTPCIPSEKTLRSECIDNINKIFTESKVTLVCDRDIMSIDISNLTMSLREALLATVLVCDWNIRAWTLLEAMRGRHNIHLLCKRNEVICFRETLKVVHEEGRIDLAILFLTTQHLMPPPPPDDWELFPGGGSTATDEDRLMEKGFVSVGEAGILLSHRHASRDNDDIVIWSLLINEKAIKNAEQIWKNQLGAKINTGFLLSSTPRFQGHKGLSWAPCCPTLRLPPDADSTREKVYLAYEGEETRSGVITSEGLQAKWLVHRFPSLTADCTPRLPRIVEITSRYLQKYSWGALLRPCASPGPWNVPAPYRGNAQWPLLAICGSNDERGWEWRGVYEWGVSDPLPEFKWEELLLV